MTKKRKPTKKTINVPEPVPPAEPLSRPKAQMILAIAGTMRKLADLLADLAHEL